MTVPLDGAHVLATVPPPVLAACRSLSAADHEVFLVGGAIRDLLLGRDAHDFDIATSARPEEVTRVFGRRHTIPTGAAHGTVTVVVEKEIAAAAGMRTNHLEVTTFRGEGAYADGRRPDAVVFLRDIVEDLRRRDFTINAMAIDPRGLALRPPVCTVVDPFGGRADLDAGIIRAVGDARSRFAEDGLRVMRAVRFAAQLGFALDPETLAAIPAALQVFRRVSMERVRDELLKILASPRPSVGLRLMHQTGMLAEVIPELLESVGCVQNRFHAHDVFDHTLHSVDTTPLGLGDPAAPSDPPDPIVRLATLLHDVAKPRTAAPKEDAPGEFSFFRHEHLGARMADDICRRLKLSNKDRERVVALVENHMFWYAPDWSDGAVRRFIGRVGEELLPDLFALRVGDVCGRGRGEDPEAEIAALKVRIAHELASQRAVKITDLVIDGGDVMRVLGRRPGPIVGVVLRRLLDRVLDDPSLNERATLEAMIPSVAQAEDGPDAA